LSSPGGI